MLNLLRTKAPTGATSRGRVSRHPGEHEPSQPGVNLEPADDLPRLPALARIVEEGERTAPEHENSSTPGRAVSERVRRMFAFD